MVLHQALDTCFVSFLLAKNIKHEKPTTYFSSLSHGIFFLSFTTFYHEIVLCYLRFITDNKNWCLDFLMHCVSKMTTYHTHTNDMSALICFQLETLSSWLFFQHHLLNVLPHTNLFFVIFAVIPIIRIDV